MNPSLTIGGLLSDPSLGTELMSGAAGVDRPVIWAHSCEMDDPARWLQPHELLMTIGHCVPSGSDQQRRFIASLDDAGLAGITIGSHQIAPRLTKALFEESEARGFPVLRTTAKVPFAAIARMVAATNSEKITMGVLRLAKLYQVTSSRTMADKRSGTPLAELFGTPITVIDDATGCIVIGDGVVADDTASGRRISLGNAVRPASLRLRPGASLDGFTLGHLSQVLEVDTNEIIRRAKDEMAAGIDGFVTALLSRADAVRVFGHMWGRDDPAYRVVAVEKRLGDRVPLSLALAGIPALTHRGDEAQLIAAPERNIADVREILGKLDLRAGVSLRYHNPGDLSGALQEATSEMWHAVAVGAPWREYAGGRVSLLARSASERDQIVSTVLGPLASDDPALVPLRETLFAFLDNNQGWKETAAELKMHRQSIVYRLNRVEELTGRSVHRTSDIAEFWLARMSWEQYVADNKV